ncbi:DinB family protein [uncultured Brachyspira sp.]|uniref:DinB family protein n=1 Tax=uncultured Brachyspira sp. TaxID=221953 RepID=UPI00262E0209|nr:DinB family protein [uncultured Brachyspira sp.]
MIDKRIKELTRKIEMESKKLDKKIKDIEKIKSSITKDLKKNVKELKNRQLSRLQEEKKNINNKVKEMKYNLLNAKKESTENKVNKRIEKAKKRIEENKKRIEEDKENKKPADKTVKKIMNMMALYNKRANDELIDILETLKDRELKKENGAYHKSIYETFIHILKIDIYLFKVYRKYSNKKNINDKDIFNYFDDDLNFNKDVDFQTIIEIRKKLDNIILSVINSIENFNSSGKVIMMNTEIKNPIYHIIMHSFNHSTHHRGEISAMLDQMGHRNDYSNLLNTV